VHGAVDYTGWTGSGQVTFVCSTASSVTPQLTVCTGDSTPAGKRPGPSAGHSPTSNVNDKNGQSFASAPACIFMTRCLVKRTYNLNFTYDNLDILGPEQCCLPADHMCGYRLMRWYTSPGFQITMATESFTVAPNIVWVLSAELSSCHPPDTWNFEVACRY
jgi:hypothetical protein